MTTHLEDGLKRDKMISFLITKPYFGIMKDVVEKDDRLENISALVRVAVEKEVRRRRGE